LSTLTFTSTVMWIVFHFNRLSLEIEAAAEKSTSGGNNRRGRRFMGR
jgi:hypothetical protein